MSLYTHIFGTGGIGTGAIYSLEGDHTLGRDETRLGVKLPNQDFCKLHNISHYLSVILKDAAPGVKVYPVGAVGSDQEGRGLLRLFETYGIAKDYVSSRRSHPTLHSICFQYPDGSGGNITESKSASSSVGKSDIEPIAQALQEKKSVVFAVPEVPLETRIHLLSLPGNKYLWKAASFLSSEIRTVFDEGVFEQLDFCAFNMDEARALMQEEKNTCHESRVAAEKCNKLVREKNKDIELVITDGGMGAFAFSRNRSEFLPAFGMKVENSAGAGDALFAGVIIGKVLGLPFISDKKISGFKLAHALASLSVESRDTINFTISFQGLERFLKEKYRKEARA